MEKFNNRVLSLICAFCILVTSYGNLLSYPLFADMRTLTLSASDGNTYRITVTYDAASGIPDDAVLSVREIIKEESGNDADAKSASADKSDPTYDNYINKSAAALGKTSGSFDVAKVFDISLTSPSDGTEYQPDKDVLVSIELLDNDLSCHTGINVVHFEGDPDGGTEVMDTEMNGASVEFRTDGFSVYVVVGNKLRDTNAHINGKGDNQTNPDKNGGSSAPGEYEPLVYIIEDAGGSVVTPQCTFTFWVPGDGGYSEYSFKDSLGHTIYRQTVISGGNLIVPQVSSSDDKAFAGWYKGEIKNGTLELEAEPFVFENIVITENSAIDLYAVYLNYASAVFHDKYDSESGTFPIAYTRRAELVTTGEGAGAVTSASVKISDRTIANTKVGGKEMAFLGWSRTPVTTPGAAKDDNGNDVAIVSPDEEGCITISEETHLYPVFMETYLLSFYAEEPGLGAAYNGPRYVNKGTYLTGLPVTSMTGRTFTGWYTGTLNGNNVEYGMKISNPDGTLITGVDDAGVYVSDNKLYVRADTTLYAGWTNNTAADYRIIYWLQNGTGSDYSYKQDILRSGTVGGTVSVPDIDKSNERYVGFHLKEEPASAVLKADGSTVLNVYYDHNADYVPSPGTYTLTFADSVTEDGKTSADLPVSVQVGYGSDIGTFVIQDPHSGRKGYEFSKWFLDPYGVKEADLGSITMPDHDLTIYAGWDVEWYIVSIDPNYGELRPLNDHGDPTGTGSTYFWQTIEREPIAEYTYVERNYVESSSGTFYYVFHPGDGKGGSVWKDRYTYYTTDISKATEDTTFEYSPGVYTYAGWYEVLANGTEIPYVFGERTDHNTSLKLHWKKNGVYYLKYNAAVDGLSGTMDDADASHELFADGVYADCAEITLNHMANAPYGYTFIGWKIRGSEADVLYTPGQILILDAHDAKRISGKDIVYLDAVYARVGTASIVYDANGGTVAESGVDFGKIHESAAGSEWSDATGTVDTAAGTAEISRLANNSKIKLSDGSGFSAPAGSGSVFLGWSDKAVCDDSAKFYPNDTSVIYGVSGSVTLYAVWGVQLTYNLNSAEAGWGDTAWDPTVYTLNGNVYSQSVKLGNTVSKPEYVPVYNAGEERLFRYWAVRTGSGTDGDPYVYTEYDFSQPVTGSLDLYAYWDKADTITVRAVDASDEVLTDKTGQSGWTVNDVTVSATEKVLDASSNVTAPENYEFAFAAFASDLNGVSESSAVTAIKYENNKILVKNKNTSSFEVLDEGSELYFVYYRKKALNIGYKSINASGALENAATSGAPANTVSLLGEYTMSDQLTAPLDLVTGFTYYAFAIAGTDPGSGTQMNVSDLNMITSVAGAGDAIPTLRVRNNWRGFEYTTETGENAVWKSCGHEPQLYVIYFTNKPSVIMFNEKTAGAGSVMDTEFTFNMRVTQTVTTTTSVQHQRKDGDNWVNDGDPAVTAITSSPEKIFDTQDEGNQPYILKNGGSDLSILLYSSSVQIGEPEVIDENNRTVTTTTTVTVQTAVITQTLRDAFTTSIDENGSAYTEGQNVYTYTSGETGGTENVTFINSHKAMPVEVHVAMVEEDGATGGIIRRDTYRNSAETAYKFDLALGESAKLLEKLPAAAYETTEGEGSEAHQVLHEGLFTGDSGSYAFGSVVLGAGTDNNPITVRNMGAVTVSYEQIDDNVYEIVLKDGEGNKIGELGSDQIYYLYYPMPKIKYVKESTDGTLTDITGCLINQTTGSIEASEAVTYGHQTLTMNGETVEQNQNFEIPLSGFVLSQSGNNFRMPPVLDDGLHERYLGYVKIGAGSGTAVNSSDLDVSDGLTMQLKIMDNTLQYSFDGTTWKDLPLSGVPTVYAIYSERGYDLQISKTVDMSQSGEDALFSGSSFTVTIRSTEINKNSYAAEGADSSTVAATPASGTEPGTITLVVSDGTKVRIKGLDRGDYTITESENENYTLTAKIGSIVGGSASNISVTDNSSVSFTLDSEKRIDLTNSPKVICKIDDRHFYTLQSMINYVDENIATKTATAEMMTDYFIPSADIADIPNDFNLTLTTAESVGRVAVITRKADLAGVPLFNVDGKLTITNLTLEGNSVEATAPMIQSAGDLTIGSGATIRDVVGGGAINATEGNITVSGVIENCSAAEGGAIYHSGNGTVTLNGTGKIINNTATSGNGGAVWLAEGMIEVSGMSEISGNKAESGNGGAVFANGIVEIKIDQGGSIKGNTAKEGGAVYANATATVSIFKTGDVSPAVTGNTATSGNGGAIYVNGGSVSVSGGSLSDNKAENGNGGAVYSNSASVTVSETAEAGSNIAKEGGAVYTVSGDVNVNGGSINNNTATAGSGGAVYAGSGKVTVSGGSLSGNKSDTASGGAIYAGSGNVSVSGGNLSDNTAYTSGGAVFAGNGSITVSAPGGGTAPTIRNNKAEIGRGGALFANIGAVSVTGTTLTGNTAKIDGGAVFAGFGAVTLTDSTFGGDDPADGNFSSGNGGAVYAGNGNVTVSGGSMKNNSSNGSGGALYVGSGTATVSNHTASDNNAAAGKGGAIYLDSGSLSLTDVTAKDNSAINGAAVFTNTGRASFNGGSYTGNDASEGGAVGVGSKNARLVFTDAVKIKDNTGAGAPKSNVYLDQDDDAVINIDTLTAEASIGIYVANPVEDTRGVPGARFAVYTNNSNVGKITNDRYTALTVQSDTAAKKLYWGNSIKVSVHKLDSYGNDFHQPANSGAGTQLGKYDAYYPEFSDAALSELASELVVKYKLDIGTKVYAAAYLDGERGFGDYITNLTWDKDRSDWYVTTRSGDTVYLTKTGGNHRIYIYYAEPAYLSIENNTEMPLTIISMKVDDVSVINSNTIAGYGMVFAKNGAIRTALLPVTESDLTLAAGQSVSLLIPGGRNKSYTLDGEFETTTGASVRLRRGVENNLIEETVTVSADGTFAKITGTTLDGAGTYNIIFGDDKIICKVVDANGVEHPYSKISKAIEDIVATTGANPPYTLTAQKTATIEMVTDYLLPASDHVLIPRGYNITLTTAAPAGTEGVRYTYRGESADGRAVISRDTENKYSMIDAWNTAWNYSTGKGTDNVNALDGTTLTISNLVFDGKSVRGESDGGAVASKYVNVYIDRVDFKNVYASNGGAMLIMFSAKDKNNKVTTPNTILDVKNSDFTGCTSWTTETSNRLGGGAIVTNAETMTLENCNFSNCTAVDQAGAVFHRVDGNYNSWTNVTGCRFTNCSANAAGGLELDSKNITVTDCVFEHCVAKERNGGGFNVWPLNSGTPSADCWVTLTGCSFLDCQALKQNGGGFRSAAVYTTVNDCTFTNTTGALGGGIAMSNTNAREGKIFGCTFDRCTANNQGGGFYCVAIKVEIGDYIYPAGEAPTTAGAGSYIRDDNGNITGRHTEIKNCTSSNEGGGIYHNRDVGGSNLTVTNAVISGNQTKNNNKNGGGIYTNARKVIIDGSSITDNECKALGGGVYANASGAYSNSSDTEFHNKIRMIVSNSTISRNTATGNGGGIWFDAPNNNDKQVLTIKGSSIDGNTSNGNGGGVYTLAKTVTIGASDDRTDSEGNAVRSSVSNNKAKNGGGIYQSRNVDGSSLTVADTDINSNTATSGAGGGIYAGVRALTLTKSTVSNNSATGNGGGVWFEINDDAARNAMSLIAEGCTLNGNTSSGGNGGGVYTLAKTVEIKAHTEGTGESAIVTRSEISNCTAAESGGGIYQNRSADGSELKISNTTVSDCVSNDTDNNAGGGGVYANVNTVTVTDSEIKNNRAAKNGGGINAPRDGKTFALILDHTTITGNSTGNQGGGVFTQSQLTLRKGTEITGNRLTTNIVDNCAGVYLKNERTLFVGPENATESTTDTVIVQNNTTANGTLSDLRLWVNSNKENNENSVYVYCNLSDDSVIRVVNAHKAGTKFGSAEFELTNGFSDDKPVFKADSSTLYGITARTDPTNKTIVWAGPPIVKLTDGNGKLLYLKYNAGSATYPAIFDRLDTGNAGEGSTASPFSMLRMDELTLYYKDGTVYTGTDYCIKMLVERYETSAGMTLPYKEGRTVTFTTAETTVTDEDPYKFEGRPGGRATVIRGSGVGNNNLLDVQGSLTLENIIIDGGSENGITANTKTRNLQISSSSGNITVTLGEGAILQNSKSSDVGGCVNLNNANAEFRIAGGTIRNCYASKDGGGVYVNGGTLVLEAGSIYQCTSNTSGGGVRVKDGVFNMSGGMISECLAQTGSGGGVFLGGGKVLNMSGGSIIKNKAKSAGGGIYVYDANSRIYFSGKVNVSGNTCDASVASNNACNVELNKDTNHVINTNNGGLYPGAYIGVYVPNGTKLYDEHGVERKPFGTFADGDNTTNFYSFVNDRNGLKGGIIESPKPNTIYWIKIFSLQVTKEVVSGESTTVDPAEVFLFKVNIRGYATASGQLSAHQIDSSTGDYGEMHFTSNGIDTTTAIFGLVDGQTISGVNLSEGLKYEVMEYLTVDQAKRYAAMPMNMAGSTTESLEYNGVTYEVVRVNTFASTIGENKERTDVDPYTSELKFSNLMPVCKITDKNGNLLYRRYDWDKVTNKTDEGQDGGSSTNQPYYYAPAVYTELTGENGAFKALENTTLYLSNGANPTSYAVTNGVMIQMLIGEYKLNYAASVASGNKVTLTTASSGDTLFPKQDAGTTSTIRRAFADGSMFSASGNLTVEKVILDGAKGSYTVAANGGIVNVADGGSLTVNDGATLQNSKTASDFKGGAVFAASGATVTMTGGTVNRNESGGDGAGIYLSDGSTLKLSGAPSFGGTGIDVSGNITVTNGNFKTGELTAQLNGGKHYQRARQDIYLSENHENVPASIIVTGDLTGADGSIWVWAQEPVHSKTLMPFAKLGDGVVISENHLKVFRNARNDVDAGNTTDTWLFGKLRETVPGYVCWSGVEGFARVILVKVLKTGTTYKALAGKTFRVVYKNNKNIPVKGKVIDAFGNETEIDLENLTAGNGGAFFIGTIPYGNYYVYEDGVDGHFEITIDKGGVVNVSGTGSNKVITRRKLVELVNN